MKDKLKMPSRFLTPLGGWVLAIATIACQTTPVTVESDAFSHSLPRQEKVYPFEGWLEKTDAPSASPTITLERISTAVPWPRGIVWHEDQLVVLARGRHRRSGGIDPAINDQAGTLFLVNPNIAEPALPNQPAGEEVQKNAQVLVRPQKEVFNLYEASFNKKPADNITMDRPYCTLAVDPVSKNFFICGFSGVDLPKGQFRKNATDSILRFDLRNQKWHVVESHKVTSIPREELSYVTPNQYYPHHDPNQFAPPHGFLNGPNGGTIVGDYLYAVGKDNHVLAQYDMKKIRERADAPPPSSKIVVDHRISLKRGNEIIQVPVLGHSATAAHDGYLYVGFRTSSVIIRFPLDETGDVIQPAIGELIAVFEPWSTETQRSANLIDLAFNSKGELFASCAEEGKVWNIGKPDPNNVFNGIDVGDRPTANMPFVDLQIATDNPIARTGNILFDKNDRLYVCSGNYDSGTVMAGVIYRVSTQ